jgi:hypothetical protein
MALLILAMGGGLESFMQNFDRPEAMTDVPPQTTIIIGGAGFLAFILAIWMSLRLTLAPPALVAERRLAIGDAFRMTRGNVWRLIGLYIVTWIAVAVLVAIVMTIVLIPLIAVMPPQPGDSQIEQLTFQRDALLVLTAINYFLTMILSAIGVALMSYSYKALKGVEASEPVS